MARAVVAMNDGGNPELIENNQSGILVGPFDQNGFVNAVLDLLGDEERRRKLGNRARDRVQQYFDVKRNAREIQELYFQFLKDK
jgi:glycosyltransferase involved in cell wall biosynthesis